MPINQSPPKSFDPYDEDSWFFGYMSRVDAQELLTKCSDNGAFLVRESTTAIGDLVLSVKETDAKVSHYIIHRILSERGQQVCFKIGEQIFLDIPALLDYYRKNNLDDTPLIVPATPKELQFSKRNFTRDYLPVVSNGEKTANICTLLRTNSQPDPSGVIKTAPTSIQRKLPVLAKVIQTRIPNAYDKTALTLKEGEIVQVTKTDISGCWEGEICGRKGHFPFNYVKFIDDPNMIGE